MKKIEKVTKVLRKTKVGLMVAAVVLSLMSTTVFAADPLASINSLYLLFTKYRPPI